MLTLSLADADQFDAVRIASVSNTGEPPRIVYHSRSLGGVERWECDRFVVTLTTSGDHVECVIEEKLVVVAAAASRAA
jgi:hypothetical protein